VAQVTPSLVLVAHLIAFHSLRQVSDVAVHKLQAFWWRQLVLTR